MATNSTDGAAPTSPPELRLPWWATKTGEVRAVAGGHICVCGDADQHGNPVDQSRAEFISLACNAHADLVAALASLTEVLYNRHGVRDNDGTISSEAMNAANAVLAKTKVGAP